MKLAVLFSGGKDSTLALHRALEMEEVSCLISISSKNKSSYMFHTPNIELTKLQAEAIGLPLILKVTEGMKEDELSDLKDAIIEAKEKYGIKGIVTGAIESIYQALRVQRICFYLGLWCFNPLWQMDQVKLLNKVVEKAYKVIISGVFAEPFDKSWLGREINKDTIRDLIGLREKIKINPSGEGGEFETTVLSGPIFKREIIVTESTKEFKNYCGLYDIKEAELR